MLIPVQTSGTKPPLFFIHGLNGLMSMGSSFARAFGPDQPVYAIHADGIDGRRPVLDDMHKIVSSYVEDIQSARPGGVIRIAGMCTGCLIAIEAASRMLQRGRQIGSVILVDPPPLPPGYDRRTSAIINPRDPKIIERIYEQARNTLLKHATLPRNDTPFDPHDPRQLHLAALAGVGLHIAYASHVPCPFSGPAVLVIGSDGAPGFFHPQMPWHKLLSGPVAVHILPWDHRTIFLEGRAAVCRLVKFALDEPLTFAGSDDDITAEGMESTARSAAPMQHIT